jgi:hypothetical protein
MARMLTVRKPSYFTGLDLGQAQDFTAIAVLEKTFQPDPEAPALNVDPFAVRRVAHYAVRHLERLPLGTPYTEVCARLARMFAEQPLSNSLLVVDQTAVGKPVVEMLRRARIRAQIRPLAITAGHRATRDDDGVWLVPKKELVSTLQVLLQSRRLHVANRLPEADTLVRELANFQVKVTTAASDMLEAWREGAHDDLVLAIAIAAWQSEHLRTPNIFAVPAVVCPGPSFPRPW